jgi:uncharacterized integral membrane protein (TIGR00698 family)
VTPIGAKRIFFLCIIISASGFVSPAVALAAGITFGLLLPHPFAAESRDLSRLLLQASVVALGFGMNLHQVVHAGASGFAYTAVSIVSAILLGTLLGRLLSVQPKAAFLITCGTAICGGSAIAAVGPVINATDEEMSVSLGTVFILNSIALFVFPLIGHRLGMTQSEFGVWAAIAIHDTSSVVGAASKYGAEALAIATTVKLTRALWIVPLTLATAFFFKKSAKITIPWFILWFVVATIIRTYSPVTLPWDLIVKAARIGLTITLFLIGAGLSRKSLARVGARPLLLGVLLWVAISAVSLFAVMKTL